MLLMLIPACREGAERNGAGDSKRLPGKAVLPAWDLPEVPDVAGAYITAPPTSTPSPKIEKGPPLIIVRRDTLNGIAVRAPEIIRARDDLPSIGGRENPAPSFRALSYVSTNNYIGVNFDNDIFNNTDYYYTNGIKIEYTSPVFAWSPLSFAMLPYRRSSMNYHGMNIVQNMYTPTNPDVAEVMAEDRPFAAYLYLGHSRNTLDVERSYRQFSELVIGLIGPGSLGGFVQAQIHSIEPRGWDNQIENDLVLNYTATFEKGIVHTNGFDLNGFGTMQAGTLYDNAGGGLRIRAGKLNPYFAMPGLAKPDSHEGKHGYKWQYGIFAKAKVKLVLYNATLQGGMFNRTSSYTIPAGDIERVLLEAGAGIYVAYKQLGLTLEQYYLSPEFRNAHHFRWGHINITYCF